MLFRPGMLFRCATVFFFLCGWLWAAGRGKKDGPAYRVYREDGTAASMEDIVSGSRKAEVVFFGEEHDDPIGHQVELKLLQQLSKGTTVALGLEMFERDVQAIVDEYLAGWINEASFLKASRPWPNYK